MNQQQETFIVNFGRVAIVILFCIAVYASSAMYPQRRNYEKTEDIDAEFQNVYQLAQAKNFTIVYSTPSTRDLQNGNIVILQNGTVISLVYRANDRLYTVTGVQVP